MRNRFTFGVLAAALLAGLGARTEEKPLRGFAPARSAAQRELEKKFLALPEASSAEAHHKILTAEPHMAGTEADRRTAEYVLEKFRAYGLEAEIEEFHVLLPAPKFVRLELLEPVRHAGPTPEWVSEDPASRDPRAVMGFNGYSASGDATAEVVYANYGLPADYARLAEEGISAKGKIVITRYGQSFRGVKAKVAEENGAAGLLIYSDPRDDGYHTGLSYPNGPMRPASGVQRGSVLYIFEYPGDPTTPDGPSVAGAPRIDAARATNMTRVPTLPISWLDARPILENLAGPAAPDDWQGGLPFTYRLGPGPAKVRLQLEMEHAVQPVWNVIGKIRGSERPDEIVLLGNHRDAWVYGAVDPNSGSAAQLELARAFGELLRGGWRPRRSLWLCSWDAEEQGLIGSTEWVEKHAAELRQKAVAYLNLDSAVSGDRFGASAVPSLKEFLREVAADTPAASGQGSVLDVANARHRKELARTLVAGRAPAAGGNATPLASREIDFGNLGSGSDYTSFLQHLGVPSTDFGFGGDYGVYHSIFDNYRWMKQWGDPAFAYHVAAARFYGLEALRLAEADLLPFDYGAYGKEIESYLGRLAQKAALMGKSSELDFAPARKAAGELATAGRKLREKNERALRQGKPAKNLDRINRALVETEQALLVPEGLPGRPWFKHPVYAPGVYTGYAAVLLPGVHERLDAQDFAEARRQLAALTAALQRAARTLNSAR